MKTKRYFLWMMMALSVMIVSCEEKEDAETCDSEDFADDFGCPVDINAIAAFCADGVNNSYYTFEGTNYMCTGVDASTCDSALHQIELILINAGCSTKKKSGEISPGVVKMTQMAEKLLNEVRNESVCN